MATSDFPTFRTASNGDSSISPEDARSMGDPDLQADFEKWAGEDGVVDPQEYQCFKQFKNNFFKIGMDLAMKCADDQQTQPDADDEE